MSPEWPNPPARAWLWLLRVVFFNLLHPNTWKVQQSLSMNKAVNRGLIMQLSLHLERINTARLFHWSLGWKWRENKDKPAWHPRQVATVWVVWSGVGTAPPPVLFACSLYLMIGFVAGENKWADCYHAFLIGLTTFTLQNLLRKNSTTRGRWSFGTFFSYYLKHIFVRLRLLASLCGSFQRMRGI